MLIVREEHGIDLANLRGIEERVRGLSERAGADGVLTCVIKGRVYVES